MDGGSSRLRNGMQEVNMGLCLVLSFVVLFGVSWLLGFSVIYARIQAGLLVDSGKWCGHGLGWWCNGCGEIKS